MQSNPQYISLIDMGCSPVLSEAAIRQLKTQDIMALLDWISDHSEEQQKWTQWLKQNQQSTQNQSSSGQGQQGQSIQPLIKKDMREALMSKGNSKNVSEKALLLTGNTSIEAAQKWIQQHKYDPDFEEEMKLQGQAYEQSKLSPQEAKAKLEELTKKAREVRKQRQQEEAKQRQKNRVRYTKQMQEAKRIAQEQAMKRQVQLDKIQKQRDEQYKRKLVEDMRRERNAKLGIKQEEGKNVTVQAKKEQKKLSLLEQVEIQCEQVKVGNHAYPDVARTFFETAQIYVNNIIKNNGEQKFRKINKENKAFQNRICQAFGGLQFLHVLGYEDEDNSLILKNYKIDELKRVSDLLQRYKAYY